MSFKTALMILLFATLLGAAQQSPYSSSQASSSQAAAASAAENAQLRQIPNARANESQALRDDVKRMRAIVRQMETNLAFVDTTQSPLKHQFQLDIDMWNVVIDQMERRAQGNAR